MTSASGTAPEMAPEMPGVRPARPHFSSGPCAKRPGWSTAVLDGASLGRSHRSAEGKARLRQAIDLTREVLEVPDDYRIAIVPASDTGAFEMAMWSLLGARGIDVFAWESFGKGWVTDITKQLRHGDVRTFEADYGDLPDLGQAQGDRDIVFTWNGTTSGVRVPDGGWIPGDRTGLTLCDATSAAFAMELPWDKLDATTYSWQKALGGEAAHGVLVLSPRAVERLESHTPAWPLPKIFRLTKGGKLNQGIFEGSTINTPSMLCVEDYLDALNWARGCGGLKALVARSRASFAVIEAWVGETGWAEFLARDPATRSWTSVCLTIADPWFEGLPAEARAAAVKDMVSVLGEQGVAYDIGSYRDAPPGFRIWTGATVETGDVEALMPWLDWAFARVREA